LLLLIEFKGFSEKQQYSASDVEPIDLFKGLKSNLIENSPSPAIVETPVRVSSFSQKLTPLVMEFELLNLWDLLIDPT